jgi:Tfp pilus assembly protein PilO
MDLNQPIKLPKMPKLDQRTALAAATLAVGVAAIWLLVKFSMALFTAHSVSAAEMNQRQLQLKAEDLQIAPLRGMDQKLATADDQAAKFYQQRFPAQYSAIAAELDKLQKDNSVKMSRLTLAEKATSANVTEIEMEASLVGDYTQLMKFINQMERDKLFFVIRGVTLTGTQGGIVNLRLRMNTYLRQGSQADAALADAITQSDAARTDQNADSAADSAAAKGAR